MRSSPISFFTSLLAWLFDWFLLRLPDAAAPLHLGLLAAHRWQRLELQGKTLASQDVVDGLPHRRLTFSTRPHSARRRRSGKEGQNRFVSVEDVFERGCRISCAHVTRRHITKAPCGGTANLSEFTSPVNPRVHVTWRAGKHGGLVDGDLV